MIVLTATRVNIQEQFRFTIEAPDYGRTVTSDPDLAAEALHSLGLNNSAALLKHARDWGVIEIADPKE